MRFNRTYTRVLLAMFAAIILIAGVRARVIGFGTIITADPMKIIAVFGALMGLLALSLLFTIARAVTEQTRILREAQQPPDPYGETDSLARVIREIRAEEAQ